MADTDQPAASALPEDPRERAKLLADKKAELDEIAQRRETLLATDRERKEKRETEAAAQTVREQAAFAEEAAAAKERAEEREEWRQGKHAKRREEEKERLLKAQQAKLEEEKRKKVAAEKARQQAYLDELHKRAYRKKVKDNLEKAETQEENENRDSEHRHERDLHALNMAAVSANNSRASDKKRQIAAAKLDAERHRSIAEDAYTRDLAQATRDASQREARARAKPGADLQAELTGIRAEVGRIRMDLTARRKRELMAIDDRLAAKLQDIELTFARLAQEAERDEESKERKIDKDLDRRKSDSAERRRRAEEWIEKGGKGHD